MSTIIHLARLMSVVGTVLLVMSFLFPPGVGIGGFVLPNTYEAQCFLVTDDMSLWVESDDHTSVFSLYIVNDVDMNQILESGTLEDIEPIFVLENVSEYQGVVHFPRPGIYGWFLSHSYNDSLIIRGVMSALPRVSFIYIGLILLSPMVVILIERLFRKNGSIMDRLLRTNK